VEYSMITIFANSGNTFTFRSVEITLMNETVLQFSYESMSDGKTKIATFPKSTICGWSMAEE